MKATEQNATHTPTPWHVGRICGHFCGIYAERGAQVADCTSPDFFPEDSKHNAAFIIRAVNSHAQLVAALEALLRNATDKERYISMMEGRDVEEIELPDEALDSPEMKQARAALTAAKGKE